MMNGAACPDQLLLSQFLDHELKEREERRIAYHLTQCHDCHAQIERLRHTDGLIRTQLPVASLSSPSLSPACPPLEKVVAYMQGSLTAPEEQQIEQHIQNCETCFLEAREAARVVVFLQSLQAPPVPAPLKARVATQWKNAESQESSVPGIVIQLAEQGLKLITYYLAPPLSSVQEVFIQQPAYRKGEYSSALTLRLHTGETEIDVRAIPENEGVAVTLTLFGPERKALADRRVFIRQQDRAIFSAQTDDRGELHVPRLEPGEYEVSCHELHTTFQLELRP
jgi:anti-sigma factor RsiW